MYNADFSKLIYSSDTQEDFIFNLKIHHSIFTRSISTGSLYLDKYVFTNQPVEGSKPSNLNIEDVFIFFFSSFYFL